MFLRDRLCPGLDILVPSESTKAYDMLDVVCTVRKQEQKWKLRCTFTVLFANANSHLTYTDSR